MGKLLNRFLEKNQEQLLNELSHSPDSKMFAKVNEHYRQELENMLDNNHGMSIEDLSRSYDRMNFTPYLRSRLLNAYRDAVNIYSPIGMEVLAEELGISENNLRSKIKQLERKICN